MRFAHALLTAAAITGLVTTPAQAAPAGQVRLDQLSTSPQWQPWHSP